MIENPLYIFERGDVMLERYYREIVLDHVRLFRDVVRPDFLFMDSRASYIETLRYQTL